MSDIFECYSPDEAFCVLQDWKRRYYNRYAAVYTGDHHQLRNTADSDSFWKRKGKAKLHVPVAADIAAMSADLLFGEEPRYVVCTEGKDTENEKNRKKNLRLSRLIDLNALHPKLCEAAESASVLGGVCMKINWSENTDHPLISIVQADDAVPEFRMGLLHCMHFFSVIRSDLRSGEVVRMYERYQPGRIEMAIFRGTASDLGDMEEPDALDALGYESEVIAPIDDMLCCYIPNMRPNRVFRGTEEIGRSDFDGLRDLMDALDETYSSWMRDVRLSKSRLIVPAEYLRRTPMFREGAATYEFDEDVETLVALDIDTSKVAGGSAIQPSQFKIREAEHAATCEQLMRNIVSMAGYAPQSFGMDIRGQAESGTALHIREKKSYATRSKKENYWKAPLERILTSLIHLDSVMFSRHTFEDGDKVVALFSDSIANDITTTAGAVNLIRSAKAASTRECVRMLHPDWTHDMVDEEVQLIHEENAEGS